MNRLSVWTSTFAGLAALTATAAAHAAAPTVEVVATGLNNPRGLAFAPNGLFYVAEAGSVGNGRLSRKPKNGAVEVVMDRLVSPAGVAIGPDEALYLSHFGIFPGDGQILRLTLD